MKIVLSLSVAVALGMMVLSGCKSKAGNNAAKPATETASTVAVVNARCPITGNKIDQAKVDPSLVLDYKGQKVGFCCPMCPPQWKKLTDAQKDEKLKAAMK